MKSLKFPVVYVDFTSPDPLMMLAHKLSEQLFGGIEFIGENSGIWDEVPAVRLARRFLGLITEVS
ncbi:hypothetical protein [Cystobacter ferrugineus]|uniref:hypothetical protein n=1 Tax=Cystobacter ferrugineus TaxID=83449 RepID=UPI0009FBB24B|nr:hypothetical protein [Cystobacter ferrugineus]